jgi:hypothetical protein
MNENGNEAQNDFEATHAAIIARTLRWADEAAARQDYREALRWVETVRNVSDALPDEYEVKRRRWMQALARHASSPTVPGLRHRRRRGSADRRT